MSVWAALAAAVVGEESVLPDLSGVPGADGGL